MKVAAEKSHNEDVMEKIIADEMFRIEDNKERVEYTLGTIIPRLEAGKWVKPLRLRMVLARIHIRAAR